MTLALIVATLKLPMLLVIVFLSMILAHVVYRDNKRSATNKAFFWLCSATSFWLMFTYIASEPTIPGPTLWYARISLFAAVLQVYLIFLLAHTIPNEQIDRNSYVVNAASVCAMFVALLTLSPFVFTNAVRIGAGVVEYDVSWGMPIFVIAMFVFSTFSTFLFAKKMHESVGEARFQFRILLSGILIMIGLIIVTIMLPFVLYQYDSFLGIAPIYVGIFLSMTAYAIIKYQLFNIRVVAVEVFVAIISLVYFVKVVIAPSPADKLVDGIIFVSTLGFGILLVRSVKQEIRAREEIRTLANKLTETNWQLARTNEQLRIIDQRKSEFVSIVSHQLRTPITAIKGYTSLLLEESFGKIPAYVIPPIEKIFISSKRLADMVTDFLDISKIEQGTMTYNFVSIDLKAMLTELAEEFMVEAEKKDISLHLHIPKKELFVVTADAGKIRQVLSNLLDNALKYTPKGEVNVYLEKDNVHGTVLVKVKDSGIGLSPDDIHHLFGKFTRGSGGQKENTDGSGLGLYVAKKMLEAHRGTIWVDSEGPGKGSTFVVQLLAEEQ